MSLNRKINNQDVTYFLDLHRNGQLQLDPSFQRRSVWTDKDRRYFLDTIFRGYPSPSIYLSKEVKDDGAAVFAVVDGKQRLETIIMFSEDRIVLRDYGDASVDGKPWSTIRKNRKLARKFLDYVLPVEQLTVGDDLNEVFDRLNRNNKNLNRQELRHAKYEGWFLEFLETEAENPVWKELGVVTTARARRMLDVQFLSELLIVVATHEIHGFDQDELDDFAARYQGSTDNNDFDQSTSDIATEFYGVRDFLHNFATKTPALARYVKKSVHLYSLWTLLCLHGVDALPADFADRYLEFMTLADEVQWRTEFVPDDEHVAIPAWEYGLNATGANTELPQRRKRHENLAVVVRG